VFGDDFPQERGHALAELYAAEERAFPGLGHADLVFDPAVRQAIAAFLGAG
jgi:hypothetical protein